MIKWNYQNEIEKRWANGSYLLLTLYNIPNAKPWLN